MYHKGVLKWLRMNLIRNLGRYWHPVLRSDIPSGVERCELCDKLFDYEDLVLLETERGITMKRYLVLDEPYGGKGIIGSVDSLDDIPYPNLVGEVIDTKDGKVYGYTGVKWELNENIPDGMGDGKDLSDRILEESVKWQGVPYYVDPENGSDDNDGLDVNTPVKTVGKAVELSCLTIGRSKIYVKGDSHIEEFRV